MTSNTVFLTYSKTVYISYSNIYFFFISLIKMDYFTQYVMLC